MRTLTETHFRFSSDILRRLGEELNPSTDQSLLELVKNSYDADATSCTVELLSSRSQLRTVRIEDDGDGMNLEAIQNGWLVLGKSGKSLERTARLNRIPSGNKGLGRLAALRLGQRVKLITRPIGEPGIEYSVEINWSDYQRTELVEDVVLQIKKGARADGTQHGTSIIISEIGSTLGRVDAKRLARGLLLLADPFSENPSGFYPTLKAKEFKDLERLVQRRYFSEAEFHLKAQVENGRGSAKVLDWRGKTLFQADHDELTGKDASNYVAPSTSFELWHFNMSGQAFSSRTVTLAEVKEWIENFGGVHLYINDLRVGPYGNQGQDWLELNLLRARSPELRPSTNNAIGQVAVRDSTGILVQKTDRSGLVENDAFNQIKRFARNALEWMARCRLREREGKRIKERAETRKKGEEKKEALQEVVQKLPAIHRKKIERSLRQYENVLDSAVKQLSKEVQLYRTLSTSGIVSGVFAHEMSHPLQVIKENVTQIENRGKSLLGQKYEEQLGKQVERIRRQAGSLSVFGQLTLDILDHEKRRPARVDVHDVVNSILDLLEPLAKERSVQIKRELAAGSPFLRGNQAAVESIVTNLVANSLKAFEQSPSNERTIVVRTEIENDRVQLRVLDNGPGIAGIRMSDIWLPGETTYPNGTGLGLTIVRDSAADLGGTVNAIANGGLGGAEMIISLPIIGA